MWPHTQFVPKIWSRCSLSPPAKFLSKKARLRRVSETPTPFVQQYAPHLHRCASLASKLWRKGNPTIHFPFVLQYASHLYSSTVEKVLRVGVTGKSLKIKKTDPPPQPPHLLRHLSLSPASEQKIQTQSIWNVHQVSLFVDTLWLLLLFSLLSLSLSLYLFIQHPSFPKSCFFSIDWSNYHCGQIYYIIYSKPILQYKMAYVTGKLTQERLCNIIWWHNDVHMVCFATTQDIS